MNQYYEIIRRRGKIIELKPVKIILVDTDNYQEIQRIKLEFNKKRGKKK